MTKSIKILCLSGLLFLVGDQFLKWWAKYYPMATLTYSHQLNNNSFFDNYICYFLSFILIGGFIFLEKAKLFSKGYRLLKWGTGFLGIGVLSNFFDLLLRKSIIDYIWIGNLAFNLADIYILLGLGLIIKDLLWPKKLI